mmetsp:Transcript_18792/g.33350  ORF Transcript_18792/g.33350 Transcript_18792/m.33350 type:complete len:212 (+) Transcript_18792:518-1153(+)|eukprot:CAMPEP_0184518792 /NCGR_PEP_ID=MMETSP0198_2-20121128/6271_1 /TAXON_ID=1112570 /ORGANISM="Thraustochytrium sp., Strain LLF1b" /LENGTH=211 /DNA_ID=CAMNT_0026909243 /DNA_START=842 /DNA_END=1477 /DNA_ORIENTATION=+
MGWEWRVFVRWDELQNRPAAAPLRELLEASGVVDWPVDFQRVHVYDDLRLNTVGLKQREGNLELKVSTAVALGNTWDGLLMWEKDIVEVEAVAALVEKAGLGKAHDVAKRQASAPEVTLYKARHYCGKHKEIIVDLISVKDQPGKWISFSVEDAKPKYVRQMLLKTGLLDAVNDFATAGGALLRGGYPSFVHEWAQGESIWRSLTGYFARP